MAIPLILAFLLKLADAKWHTKRL